MTVTAWQSRHPLAAGAVPALPPAQSESESASGCHGWARSLESLGPGGPPAGLPLPADRDGGPSAARLARPPGTPAAALSLTSSAGATGILTTWMRMGIPSYDENVTSYDVI